MTEPSIRFRNGPKHLLGSLALLLLATLTFGSEQEFEEFQFSLNTNPESRVDLPIKPSQLGEFIAFLALASRDEDGTECALVIDHETDTIQIVNFGSETEDVILITYIDSDAVERAIGVNIINQLFLEMNWVRMADWIDLRGIIPGFLRGGEEVLGDG